MQRQATRFAHVNARRLRHAMTDAEQRLWFHLRRQQLGARFRRPHPFASFIADFACLDPRIVIEVDGSQHVDQRDRDAMRDAIFATQGFIVLRFNANEVLSNTNGVLAIVFDAIERARSIAPSPTLPQGGRGLPEGPT